LSGYYLIVSAQQPSQEAATPVVRITTHLVLVDVIATGKDGKPVSDLTAEDFVVEDNGKKQKISIFSLQQPVAGGARPTLPPDIYSNRPEYNMPAGPLTVLLIDGLNTSFANQAQARVQLIRYAAAQQKPGQQTAIYALGNQLYKIQEFTSDPAVLRAALESYTPVSLPAHGSNLPPQRTGSTGIATGSAGVRGLSSLAAGEAAIAGQAMQQFQLEQTAPSLQFRIETTLAAMRAIARELDGHLGRKNLVWVTAGFPFSLIPEINAVTYVNTRAADPTGPPPLPTEQTFGTYNQDIQQHSNQEVKRTAALLSDAQIAIYPVDVRGLVGATTSDASSAGLTNSGLLMMGNEFGQNVAARGARLEASQASMHDMAQQTGGRIFINRNDIDNSVGVASSDGSTYYALGYYPEKKKFDGSFHKLKVAVNKPGVQLRYRSGYFAIDPASTSKKDKDAEFAGTLHNDAVQATMVPFDASVVPPPPAAKVQLPVKFRVRPDAITLEESKDGGRHMDLDFFVAALTKNGKTAASAGKTVDITVNAEQYAQVQQKGLLLPMEVSLSPGEYRLRLAVRDNRTGYIGTLTVPLVLPKP
jgi:VWFA-related protein